MHPLARVLALAYVALALIAGVVYGTIVANNVNTAEVRERLPGNVAIASVELNWSGNRSNDAWVVVNLGIRNPGKVAIEIISVNFELFVNWSDDPRPWYDPQKLAETRLTLIQAAPGRGAGATVGPGEARIVPYQARVPSNSPEMAILDHPDPGGRYHFVVLGPWIAYVFVDFELDARRVFLPIFYDPLGVLPSG